MALTRIKIDTLTLPDMKRSDRMRLVAAFEAELARLVAQTPARGGSGKTVRFAGPLGAFTLAGRRDMAFLGRRLAWDVHLHLCRHQGLGLETSQEGDDHGKR